MRRSSEETKLSKAIRDAFDILGIWWVRVQSGKFAMKRGGYMHAAENGTPDLWTPYGLLEVKDLSPLSDDQRAWHSKAESHNVRVAVVRSPREAIDVVSNWKKEDEKKMCDNTESSNEIQHAAKRYKEARAKLITSDAWREFLDSADQFNDTLGIDALKVDCSRVDNASFGLPVTEPDATVVAPTEPEQKYDDATVDGIVRRALSGIETVESAMTIIKISSDCGLDSKTVSKSLKRIGALNNGGVKRGVRYYLPVAATEQDEA